MALKGRREKRGLFKGYQARPPEKWREKARETAGTYDRYIIDGIETFSVRDGSNRIRILPATWDNADDWAYPLFVHYGVGADEQTYLCPREMGKSKTCPVCEEALRLSREGDQEASRRLRAKKRYGCWLIDRKDPSSGPQFWAMPYTVWNAANLNAEDEEGGILTFDHPDEGYDILFRKEGSRDRTQYLGLKLARNPSPVSDDEDEMQTWLDYVAEKPVPKILKVYDTDRIAAIFGGQVGQDEGSEEEEEEEIRPRPKKAASVRDEDDDDDYADADEPEEDEDEEVRPRKRTSKRPVEDEEDEDEDEDEMKEEEEEDEDEEVRPARGPSVRRRLEQAASRSRK